MSWQDHHRRRAALDAALAVAARTGGHDLGYDRPHIRGAFTSEAELLGALHYRWHQLLTAQLQLAMLDGHATGDGTDATDAATTAWRATARRAPALRAALDAHAGHPALREPTAAEHRMLAGVAGLTDAGDTAEDAARVGSALLGLVRTRISCPAVVGRRVLRKITA